MTETTTKIDEIRHGEVLAKTAKFVADHSFAQPHIFTDPARGDVSVFGLLKPNGSYDIVPQDIFDRAAGAPSARKGTATMTSLDSFIAHVNRFGDADSAVFANEERSDPSVLAVLDYHRADTLPTDSDEGGHGDYRFGEHRTSFRFPLSDEWKAWHAQNGDPMTMPEFAAFLEDNVLDVAEIDSVPESASRFVEMMGGAKNIADWSKLTALAKSLTVFENAVCSEAVNLSNGEGQLTIGAEHETEVAGVKVKVPTMFFIAIPIFREGPAYRLPVRLRYRKHGSRVTFSYEIWRSDRAFKDAFNEAVERIGKETQAQVFYGKPE